MINIFVSNGKAFVWNAKDVLLLRSEHRIVGTLVGVYPRQSFQNMYKYLPLQLLPEEATLLAEKGIAKLITNKALARKPNETVKEHYYVKRSQLCDEQIVKYKEKRLQEVTDLVNEIHKGKKRKHEVQSSDNLKRAKLDDGEKSQETDDIEQTADKISEQGKSETVEDKANGECQSVGDIKEKKSKPDENTATDEMNEQDKKAIIESEMARIGILNKETCMVQLFTECIWKKKDQNVPANWCFPLNESDKVRYAVFKDLWEKKYYLTPGVKFGGDFLAYAGDPVKFHALYIVICIVNKDFRADDLIAFGRLGNQVKKSVVLASLDFNGDIEYITLNWTPAEPPEVNKIDVEHMEEVEQ